MTCSWWALERAHEVPGDPASVEVARLRPDQLVVEVGRFHAAGVERDVVAQGLVAGRRLQVRPGDDLVAKPQVGRETLELAPCGARRARGEPVADVVNRDVDH